MHMRHYTYAVYNQAQSVKAVTFDTILWSIVPVRVNVTYLLFCVFYENFKQHNNLILVGLLDIREFILVKYLRHGKLHLSPTKRPLAYL